MIKILASPSHGWQETALSVSKTLKPLLWPSVNLSSLCHALHDWPHKAQARNIPTYFLLS